MVPRIFISYARDDDEPFAERLYNDLTEEGFEVWWDRHSMPSRRLTFYQEIADAIRSHDKLLLIVGPKAGISDYVRQEWHWALQLDNAVVPILRKGDYPLVPGELSLLHCEDFRNDSQYQSRLTKLIENLRLPDPPLGALYGVPTLPPHFLCRPELLRRVRDALLVDLQKPVVITASDARVGVQGMGGIGKSVLAAALARDREVRRSYPDGIIWVAVGQQSSLVRLQHDVARHLGSREHFDSVEQGKGVLRQLLAQKAVLLILDDVWSARDTQAFDVLGPRCRALVTTRDAGILQTLGGQSVPVSLFTETEALQLLADAIGVEQSALPPEANEIVKECGCLPLAIALCGGMAKKYGGDWIPVLQRLRAADLEKIADRQAINEQHESIWRAMKASVDVLSPDEQQRFAELSVFVTDTPIPEAAVATLWSHTSNLSDLDTTDLLVNLAERSLIRLDQKPVKSDGLIERRLSLHDLLYDFTTKLAGNSESLHVTLIDAYQKDCPDGWHAGPDDGYFYQHLAWHLREGERRADLMKLLFDFRWLRSKLNATDPNALIADYDSLGGNRQAQLVQGAIRLSSHILADDPSHLPSQLQGRLMLHKGARIKALLSDLSRNEKTTWLRSLTPTLTPAGSPLLRTLAAFDRATGAMAVTGDGRYAVCSWYDLTLKVWDLTTGKIVQTLRGHEHKVCAVAITSNGRYAVSGSEDRTLKVWDLAACKTLHTLRGHKGEVYAVAVTGDGRYVVSGSHDKTLKFWDLATGKTLRTLCGHQGAVTAVAVTSDGRHAVSTSWDDTLKVWDLATGKTLHTLRGRGAVAVTGDGRYVVSGSEDRTLKVWDLAIGKPVQTLCGHEEWVAAVAVTDDGRYVVSGSWDRTLKIWDLVTGKTLHTLRGHYNSVLKVAVTGDGRYVVSGSWDQTVKVWDLAACKTLHTLRGHMGEVTAVAVTGDGCYAVSGSKDKTLKVWDMGVHKAVQTLRGHEDEVTAVAVTGDGHYAVSASDDQTLKVWDLATGKAVQTLRGHKRPVCAVAVTNNGRCAVSGSYDNTLKVWNLVAGKAVQTLRGHYNSVHAVAVTGDGHYAVSGSEDQTLKVWDLATGEAVQTLRGHHNSVHAVALTGDGRYAVSGSYDQTLKVWDLETARVVASFAADSSINSCTVAPNGLVIVGGDSLGRVHFLRFENVL